SVSASRRFASTRISPAPGAAEDGRSTVVDTGISLTHAVVVFLRLPQRLFGLLLVGHDVADRDAQALLQCLSVDRPLEVHDVSANHVENRLDVRSIRGIRIDL